MFLNLYDFSEVSRDNFTWALDVILFSGASQKELFGCGIPPEFMNMMTLVPIGHRLTDLGCFVDTYHPHLTQVIF